MTARETAFKILLKFEQTRQHLDFLIDTSLQDGQLSARERKFSSNLVSGVIRHLTLFDWKIATLYKGNYKKALVKFKTILRLSLYEIDFLDFIPPHATVNEYVNLAKKQLPKAYVSTVNAIIRTYLREGKSLKPEKRFKYDDTRLAIRYSFPEWLIRRWLGTWDKDFVEKMCQAFNHRPVFDIRVNKCKIGPEEFEQKLRDHKIEYSQSTYFSHMFKITDMQKIRQLKWLENGYCSIQDESGYIVTSLLDPISDKDRILDACAAPGSKYTALLEKYSDKISLYAHEINYRRLRFVKQNCQRLDFSDGLLINGDSNFPPLKNNFDQILIDAPCSGFGTIQKHPDIKWRRSLEEILNFQKLQLSILKRIGDLLKPNGILIYSTCTIEPSENETVIEEYLKSQMGKFKVVAPPASLKEFSTEGGFIRTFPHLHEMEGSFAAKLQRIS
jgi:16S rRNA (cytosine967-C5)-methyltransferase